MATRMTTNGVSTTTAPGTEQYETFYSAHRGKRISRVMYDYRDTDNELFSCVAPTLAECRHKCDEWLLQERKPEMNTILYFVATLIERYDRISTTAHSLYANFADGKKAMQTEIVEGMESISAKYSDLIIDIDTVYEWRYEVGNGHFVTI